MIFDDQTPEGTIERDVKHGDIKTQGEGSAVSTCSPPADTVEPSPCVYRSDEKDVSLYQAAGFWIRLLAFSIDLIIVCGLDAMILNHVLPFSSGFTNKIIHINALFLGFAGVIYFILMTYYFQQTLGKMITGIQVIQRSGTTLSWSTTIFRELVARSLSQFFGLNLGYIFCWFNSEKRCLHDYLSDTWVVYSQPAYQRGYVAVNKMPGSGQ